MTPLEKSVDARRAGLKYVDTSKPGYTRVRRGRGFAYRNERGQAISSTTTLKRIKSLAIPPAWNDVWICKSADGHIQAVGRDDKGRKQYRYHADWHTHRGSTKFGRMPEFASALPSLRRSVVKDLQEQGLSERRVLAAVVRLLDKTAARIGNDDYAKTNGSFGISTLKDRHVTARGEKLQIRFRGKGGKMHELSVEDRLLAKVVTRCQDLPGQRLFEYKEGRKHKPITSTAVNDYIEALSGERFTAKDFRTWTATVLFIANAKGAPNHDSERKRKQELNLIIEEVADELGNTPTVCRKSYIHPGLIDLFLDGDLQARIKRAERSKRKGLRKDEATTAALIQSLDRENRKTKSAA